MVPPTQVSGGYQSMVELLWVVVLVAVLLLVAVKVVPIKRVTVYEYQKGLKYTKGCYAATLNAGQYWILSTFSSVVPVDIRPQFATIQGQDVLSADGVTLKVSLAAEFQVADPNVAINKNASFQNSLYLTLQMAVREIVGKEKIDTLIENRAGFSSKLTQLTSAKATEFGLKLISADIKDIMFPGEMKKAFAQVVKAQKTDKQRWKKLVERRRRFAVWLMPPE
jgi:regulator of protease activity HflC (stomatin/prohibitin superfamily)